MVNAEDKPKFFLDSVYTNTNEPEFKARINKDKKKGKVEKKINDEEEISEKPPLFPCEPPVCRIIDESLPEEFCDNQCEHCQGRIDKRIWPFYFTICIP